MRPTEPIFTKIFNNMARQEILEQTQHSIIVALSETEIGKVILPLTWKWVDAQTGKPADFLNAQPTMADEVKALKFANGINDLLPKFIRRKTWQAPDGKKHKMIVMERLYPLPLLHFDLPARQEMMVVFEEKLRELHRHLFVHGDLVRPTRFFNRGDVDWMFKNIVQTESCLRLLDTGFGKICNPKKRREFLHLLLQENRELACFKEYYLASE